MYLRPIDLPISSNRIPKIIDGNEIRTEIRIVDVASITLPGFLPAHTPSGIPMKIVRAREIIPISNDVPNLCQMKSLISTPGNSEIEIPKFHWNSPAMYCQYCCESDRSRWNLCSIPLATESGTPDASDGLPGAALRMKKVIVRIIQVITRISKTIFVVDDPHLNHLFFALKS